MDVFWFDQIVATITPRNRGQAAFRALVERCAGEGAFDSNFTPVYVPHGTRCNASETCETNEMMATQWYCDDGTFVWDSGFADDKGTWCPLWRHCAYDGDQHRLSCLAEDRVDVPGTDVTSQSRADRLPLNLDPRLRHLSIAGEHSRLLPEQLTVRMLHLEVRHRSRRCK